MNAPLLKGNSICKDYKQLDWPYHLNQLEMKTLFIEEAEEENLERQATRHIESVAIRRMNRQDQFQRKRSSVFYDGAYSQKLVQLGSQCREAVAQFCSTEYSVENVPLLLEWLVDEDIIRMYEGVIGLRKVLSLHAGQLGAKMVKDGLLKVLVAMSAQLDQPHMVLEATWCLVNIFSVVDIPWETVEGSLIMTLALELLECGELAMTIFQNIALCIGNIAAGQQLESKTYLQSKKVTKVLAQTALFRALDFTDTTLQSVCWAIGNLCRGNPLPNYSSCKQGVHFIMQSINLLTSQDGISDCLYVLIHHINVYNRNIGSILDGKCFEFIIELIGAVDTTMQNRKLCFRLIGNCTAGDDQVVERLLDLNLLEVYRANLDTNNTSDVHLEISWALSNIAVSGGSATQRMINFPDLMPTLQAHLHTGSSLTVQKQLCFVFTNLSQSFTHPLQYLQFIRLNDLVEVFDLLLQAGDSRISLGIMDCIGLIMRYFIKRENQDHCQDHFVRMLDSEGTLKRLEQLQFHEDVKVYQEATTMIKMYFDVEREEEYDGCRVVEKDEDEEDEDGCEDGYRYEEEEPQEGVSDEIVCSVSRPVPNDGYLLPRLPFAFPK